MTSTLKDVNIQLDDLIWKSFALSNTEEEYSEFRISIIIIYQIILRGKSFHLKILWCGC